MASKDETPREYVERQRKAFRAQRDAKKIADRLRARGKARARGKGEDGRK